MRRLRLRNRTHLDLLAAPWTRAAKLLVGARRTGSGMRRIDSTIPQLSGRLSKAQLLPYTRLHDIEGCKPQPRQVTRAAGQSRRAFGNRL